MGKGKGMVQDQFFLLVPGTGTHCVVQSELALGRMIVGSKNPLQDKTV